MLKIFSSFVAARDEPGALEVADKLLRAGYDITSDPLGEFVKNPRKAAQVFMLYEGHLTSLSLLRLKYFGKRKVSLAIKPSRLGLEIDQKLFEEYAEKLCSLAKTYQVKIWFDAEKKEHQIKTLESVVRIKQKTGAEIGLAVQAMHFPSQPIVEKLLENEISVRLVKGAYRDGNLEESQQITDNFLRLFLSGRSFCRQANMNLMAVGTHDSKILDEISLDGNDDDVEYQFLFGIRTKLQEEMREKGKGVLIYMPWGTIRQGAGYIIRRYREGIQWNALSLLLENMNESEEFRKKYQL